LNAIAWLFEVVSSSISLQKLK